jgi:hypothetical protein
LPVLPSFGVQFQNRLKGCFRLQALKSEERPARLELAGEVPNLLAALFCPRVSLKGVICLDGFADDKPVSGEMQLIPLCAMRLQLRFADNGGAGCCLETAKDLDVREALTGKSELNAVLRRQSGEELGSVRLEVDLLQSFGQFWGSLRPTSDKVTT